MKIRHVLLFCIALFVLACLAFGFSVSGWGNESALTINASRVTINKLHPLITTFAVLLGAGLWLLAIISIWQRTWPYRLGLWLTPVLLLPAFVASMMRIPCYAASRQVEDSVGNVYALLEGSGFPGPGGAREYIGRLRRRNPFVDEYDVIAEGGADSVMIVRPVGTSDDDCQLYISDQRWLQAVVGENWLEIVYDLKTGQTYRDDTLRQFSPFLLISGAAKMRQDDIRRMLASNTGFIEKGDQGTPYGLPSRDQLLEELRNSRKDIRDLARRLLDAKRYTAELPDCGIAPRLSIGQFAIPRSPFFARLRGKRSAMNRAVEGAHKSAHSKGAVHFFSQEPPAGGAIWNG
ncbi:MAG: hypothetical protein ACHQ50_11720 [Fimbriimonadales bacterium]